MRLTIQQFFEGVKAGRLTVLRCQRCGQLEVPPKAYCRECGGKEWDTTPLSGDGTVATYTVIRVAPGKMAKDIPYTVALVKMKEGVTLMGRMVGCSPDQVRVGLPVRFQPLPQGDQAIIGFAPI